MEGMLSRALPSTCTSPAAETDTRLPEQSSQRNRIPDAGCVPAAGLNALFARTSTLGNTKPKTYTMQCFKTGRKMTEVRKCKREEMMFL